MDFAAKESESKVLYNTDLLFGWERRYHTIKEGSKDETSDVLAIEACIDFFQNETHDQTVSGLVGLLAPTNNSPSIVVKYDGKIGGYKLI